MVVVAFITLLQNPFLGSPSWLPVLAAAWAGAFIVTMVLQSTLPLPNIQRWGQLFMYAALALHPLLHGSLVGSSLSAGYCTSRYWCRAHGGSCVLKRLPAAPHTCM